MYRSKACPFECVRSLKVMRLGWRPLYSQSWGGTLKQLMPYYELCSVRECMHVHVLGQLTFEISFTVTKLINFREQSPPTCRSHCKHHCTPYIICSLPLLYHDTFRERKLVIAIKPPLPRGTPYKLNDHSDNYLYVALLNGTAQCTVYNRMADLDRTYIPR